MRTHHTALAAVLLLPALAAARTSVPVRGATSSSGIRAEAMGNAFRAVASTNEAIFFNLAGMTQLQKYELDASYALDNGDGLSRFNASIVDSQTSRLATGLSYTRLSADGVDGDLSGNIVHLGFALPLGDAAALGFGGKYLDLEQRAGTLPGTPAEDTGAITADAGLLVRAGEWVRVALTGTNLIDVSSRQAPRQLGGGLSVGRETSFQVAVDGVIDLSDEDGTGWSVHGGGEVLLVDILALRAGVQHSEIPVDLPGRTYLSAGAALLTTKIAVELAYVQDLGSGLGADRLFGLGLKLFL